MNDLNTSTPQPIHFPNLYPMSHIMRAASAYLRSTGCENGNGSPVRIPSSGACPGVLLHVCGLWCIRAQARVPGLLARCSARTCSIYSNLKRFEPLGGVPFSGGTGLNVSGNAILRFLRRARAPCAPLAAPDLRNPTLEVPETL